MSLLVCLGVLLLLFSCVLGLFLLLFCCFSNTISESEKSEKIIWLVLILFVFSEKPQSSY